MSKFKAQDLRTDSICINCDKFGDCKYAREGKQFCGHFRAINDED